MDDATNFSSDTDPAETSKLGKHHSSSVNFRDDGGGDVSWGHSKDVKEMCSDKTHITNSSTVGHPSIYLMTQRTQIIWKGLPWNTIANQELMVRLALLCR
jgi:hypothetical protein